MAKKDKVEVEAPVEAPESPSRAKLLKVIEKYKVSNPVKYELKKAELEAKLAKCK